MIDLSFGLIPTIAFILMVSYIHSRSRNKNSALRSESTGRSWAETISDEENPWLRAMRATEKGDYPNAASAFLDDALRFQRVSPSRTAISCANAAACLVRIGLMPHAKQALETAANSFMLHADNMIERFPRESLWATNRAYLCFYLAGNMKKAEEAASQSALTDSLLAGSSRRLEISILKDELETAARSPKKLRKEDVAGFPVLGLYIVELTDEPGKTVCSKYGDDVLEKFAENVKAKLEELSTTFK